MSQAINQLIRQILSDENLNQELIAIRCSSDFHDDIWRFDSGRYIDFSLLNYFPETFPFWNKSLGLNFSPSTLAKLLFIDASEGAIDFSIFRNRFRFILIFLHYQALRYERLIKNTRRNLSEKKKSNPKHDDDYIHKKTQDLLMIDKAGFPELIEYLLMHSVSSTGRLQNKLSPTSAHVFFGGFFPERWDITLRRIGLGHMGFSFSLSDKTKRGALKQVVEQLSADELTYAEWNKGGSFNHLTLDYGRYYVEHCSSFFSENVALATALRLTSLESMKACSEIIKTESHRLLIINRLLHNTSIDTLTNITTQTSYARENGEVTKGPKYNRYILEDMQNIVREIFAKHYRLLKAKDELLSISKLKKLAKPLGLSVTDEDHIDWLRQIVITFLPVLNPIHNSSSNEQLLSDKKWLEESIVRHNDKFNFKKLKSAIKKHWDGLCEAVDVSLPSPEFFHNAGVKITQITKRSSPVSCFLQMVESAGLIQIIALTGFRKSEYGWTLNDIIIERNKDLLDQLQTPWRYTVKWYVPKTGGKAKLRREITQSVYLLASQLAKLTLNKKDIEHGNHLFSISTTTQNIEDPRKILERSVQRMWLHFVDYYIPFQQLDLSNELSTLHAKDILSNEDVHRLRLLEAQSQSENWEHLQKQPTLKEAYCRSREERDRVEFFINDYDRLYLLSRYRQGLLPAKMKNLLESFLSKETKNFIFSKPDNYSFSPTDTTSVMNEIMEDCLYPTPHAFRHMWAEAVYRRFDGDAGWMIRSQFKHINQTMWLAYIRDKDSRRQHDKVKRRAINSILSNYLRKKGRGYAGKLDILLRRLFPLTKIASIKDIDGMISEFTQLEIGDIIKSNPWGYCILLKRNQRMAKCSRDGVPQRQDAAPELCLGCINNLTQEGNVHGILAGISNDIQILKTKGLPDNFRDSARKTVRNALKQLKKLDVAPKVLDALESALDYKGAP